ncbi:MAG: uracil-DNA glycosylase [Myxococcales bacterium]|nr:uracil-DNA glycosylase [Myxococcales bacterium]
MSAVRAELARLVAATRGALAWHMEGGERDLPVPDGWAQPSLGRGQAFRAFHTPSAPPAPNAEIAAPSPVQALEPVQAIAPASHAGGGPLAVPRPAAPVGLAAGVDGQAALALHQVRAELGACARCRLCEGRTEIVFGAGSPAARVLFVADAPGRLEDELGLPFVGEPGRLLGRMIHAMGLSRGEVYLTYLAKCSPGPGDVGPDTLAACGPFFDAQVAAVNPEVIVALGEGAAAALGAEGPLARVHGQWLEREGRAVMPTFHPKALIQHPRTKREVWSDLKKVMRRLGIDAPPPPRG